MRILIAYKWLLLFSRQRITCNNHKCIMQKHKVILLPITFTFIGSTHFKYQLKPCIEGKVLTLPTVPLACTCFLFVTFTFTWYEYLQKFFSPCQKCPCPAPSGTRNSQMSGKWRLNQYQWESTFQRSWSTFKSRYPYCEQAQHNRYGAFIFVHK